MRINFDYVAIKEFTFGFITSKQLFNNFTRTILRNIRERVELQSNQLKRNFGTRT